ncbi:MAG: acetate kinase [Actinobacteria bacterium]|nr:acetate kinase [Actinomycetota bacterium]
MKLLTVNCGSTSIKFKLYRMPEEVVLAVGKIENIGLGNSLLTFISDNYLEEQINYSVADHRAGLELIIKKLSDSFRGVIKDKSEIKAIGHRVVNVGDKVSENSIIDDRIINLLEESCELAPLHNPANLTGIKVCREIFGSTLNVAVFDNIFHKDIPPKAYLYGIPYDYYEKYRIRKYGFHGIAYTYMVSRLAEFLNRALKDLKVVAIMLGGGSSITAVELGKSVDTSMGFTPAEGLFMSTRSGDMDPAIITFLMKKEDLNPEDVDEIINQKSGLLGLSGKYKDFKDIEKGVLEGDPDCIRAFDSYCYRIKKYIGAYAAAMNGIDAVVIAGGIGENSSLTRQCIFEDMDFLGIIVDKNKNKNLKEEGFISSNSSRVKVLVVRLDEEIVIARETFNLIK